MKEPEAATGQARGTWDGSTVTPGIYPSLMGASKARTNQEAGAA